MPIVLKLIILFVGLLVAQILVLSNIQFLGFINPYIYLLFILSLPARMPRFIVLLLGFALGLVVDAFSNTMGMHAFATTLLAYARHFVTNLFISLDEGSNPMPSFRSFGVGAYVKYVVTLVFLHHAALFILESFSFQHVWLILLKVIFSTIVSVLVILGLNSFERK